MHSSWGWESSCLRAPEGLSGGTDGAVLWLGTDGAVLRPGTDVVVLRLGAVSSVGWCSGGMGEGVGAG